MSDEVKLALLERSSEEHERRIRKVEQAVGSLGELAITAKNLKWLLVFFVSAWPILIYFLNQPTK